MKYFLMFLLSGFISCSGNGQESFKDKVHSLNKDVLVAGQKNRAIERDIGEDESIQCKYIGSLNDSKGNIFYILNTIHKANKNVSPTYSNFVMVYGGGNEFKGHYYLSFPEQLPEGISENQIIFGDLCKGQGVKVSFANGIPKAINLGCKDAPNYYEFIEAE
jgi:hypothetical protein